MSEKPSIFRGLFKSAETKQRERRTARLESMQAGEFLGMAVYEGEVELQDYRDLRIMKNKPVLRTVPVRLIAAPDIGYMNDATQPTFDSKGSVNESPLAQVFLTNLVRTMNGVKSLLDKKDPDVFPHELEVAQSLEALVAETDASNPLTMLYVHGGPSERGGDMFLLTPEGPLHILTVLNKLASKFKYSEGSGKRIPLLLASCNAGDYVIPPDPRFVIAYVKGTAGMLTDYTPHISK